MRNRTLGSEWANKKKSRSRFRDPWWNGIPRYYPEHLEGFKKRCVPYVSFSLLLADDMRFSNG